MNRVLPLLLWAMAVLVSGCAMSRAGSDDATYYYANREPRTSMPTVQAHLVARPASGGPAGVARTVYFDFDRSGVRSVDQGIVQAHAAYLKRWPAQKVTLEGHADPRGGREYNLALGQRRAQAVRQSLVLLGVNDANIEAVSFGMEKPVSTSATEAGFALDRRAEFSYR